MIADLILHIRSEEEKRIQRLSDSAFVYLCFKTAFVLFLYVTEVWGVWVGRGGG